MGWYEVFQIAIALAEGVLGKMKGAGMAVEQLEDAEAAIATLKKFHGSPVTKAQMESLRG